MDNYSSHYSRAIKERFSRERLPVSAIHPFYRHTRLGAYLREATQNDDTIGHLSRAVLVGQNGDGTIALHDEPVDTTPLHMLRDAVMENPEHPLATAFNWEHLPEKVELDNRLEQLVDHYNAKRVGGYNDLEISHLSNPPRYDPTGIRPRVAEIRQRLHDSGNFSVNDIDNAIRRTWFKKVVDRLQHQTGMSPPDDSYFFAPEFSRPNSEHLY